MHLLITRPIDQALQTAKKLQKLGHHCTIEPLLAVEETGTKFPAGVFDAIVITSANALPALDNKWPKPDRANIPVVTTGESTKTEVQALGFENCNSVNGSALDLVDYFPTLIPKARNVLYPCAERISVNLVQLLKSNERSCTSWIVYRMNKVQKLTAGISTDLVEGKVDGILLYSSNTAETFSNFWMKEFSALPVPRIFALSQQICDVLPPELSQHCSCPANPNENDLFKLISKSTINGIN